MKFEIHATCGAARAGTVTLPRGSFDTPVFMPVGTQASVKAMSAHDVMDCGYNLILSNAYHLYLRPGHELLDSLGGVQKFMAWPGLALTDSGGFQIFSLKSLMKLTDEGMEFRSHIDGSKHFMSPEDNMGVQKAIGADMIMALDECPPAGADKKHILDAVERTVKWVARCKTVSLKSHQTLIPIIQGGVDPDMRRLCVEEIVPMGFNSYAIGGLSVGEEKPAMMDTVQFTTSILPHAAPRYLMGVGMPDDIFNCVERGVDMFDCVLPTRVARNGLAFTMDGRVNLRNACHRDSDIPIEADCGCYACRNFSRAYIRHMFIAGEIMGPRLTTFHNLFFYARITALIRSSIKDGTFNDVKNKFIERYDTGGNDGSGS